MKSRLTGGLIFLFALSTGLRAGVDNLKIVDTPSWNCTDAIKVMQLSVSGEFNAPKKLTYYNDLFAHQMYLWLLGRKGITEVGKDADLGKAHFPLILEGSFVELNSGSAAKRFLVGFGAGSSHCAVKLTGKRASDGEIVFEAEDSSGSAMSLNGDIVEGNLLQVARDLGQALTDVKAECDPAAVPPPKPPEPTAAGQQPPATTIDILSAPPDADVFIDGKYVGSAPLAHMKISEGTHLIELKKTGYVVWSRSIEITEGNATRAVATLESIPAP